MGRFRRGVVPQGGDFAGQLQFRSLHDAGSDELDSLPLQHPGPGGGRSTRRLVPLYITIEDDHFTLTNAYSLYYGGYPFTTAV